MSQPFGLAGWETVANQVTLDGLADDVGQHLGGDRRMGWDGALRVGGIEAVEAEDRVEVDQPAALELGHLGIGQLDPHAVLAGELGEAAADADDGAAPQFGGVSVPHDGRLVVVAVRAQRLAQAGVVFFVPLAAGDPPPVWARRWPCGGGGSGQPCRRW